ncbi:MAG: hypothetical protein IAI49_14475 [Candidatus Eremiobacteraeota bacterium]|nr:hypothetical protein [Candidatus Eremiobacteraeota bacterium]
MSIVNNGLVTGFLGSESAPYLPPSGAYGEAAPVPASDAIAYSPAYGSGGSTFGALGGLYGGSSSGSTGLGGFGGIMNGFMNMLSCALNALSSMFGGTSSSSPTPSLPGPSQQTYFANATASSVGDPHDAFDGTTGQGTAVSEKWNSMEPHGDLLDSNSFAGGYRVSTTCTAPESNGVTYNASASVVTDGGATNVTLNANGSYAVTEGGQSVTLTRGEAVPLDGTESVTLGADGSLTIADSNTQGRSISTVLSSNGRGVDVKSTAANVDLGGYLVNHTNVGGMQPLSATAPYASQAMTYPFGTLTAQGTPGTSPTDLTTLLQEDVAQV